MLLQHFQRQALLVIPDWPTQACFALARQLSRHLWKLPALRLSQRVGETVTFAASRIFQHLLGWGLVGGLCGNGVSTSVRDLRRGCSSFASPPVPVGTTGFCSFIKGIDFLCISDTEILSFLYFIFLCRNFSPSSISSFRSALVGPLSLVFGIGLTGSISVVLPRSLVL